MRGFIQDLKDMPGEFCKFPWDLRITFILLLLGVTMLVLHDATGMFPWLSKSITLHR